MKTMELINFQSRIDDIVADIIKISNVMIFETLTSFKKYMGLFHKLCDDVAHVDVIQSLAEASIRNNYVKPTFADYTEVQESRHPMLDILTPDKIIPNLISSCEYYNIHIITGPNGSGKSIFIRQVILLQIMAQIGGYVPARSAVFKPADRLFARVYLEDNMECGASSFVLEMKEVIYILNNMTRSSLIVIDELARSTSLEEGAALAMAICERLAVSSAFVYLTSHFTLVTKLGEMYLNVKNWHMYTDAMGDTPRSLKLDFRYTLKNGVTNLERYGVFMVKNIWPSDILEDVYTILEQSTTPKPKASTLELSKETRLKYALKSDLHKLKSKGKLTLSKVNKLINQYRNELESLNVNFGNFDVNNVRWKQEEYQQMDYQGHFLDPEFIDPTSDEILSEAADRALDSLQEDYQNESFPVNSNLSYESSKYRQLSQFIDDDIDNLNLLNPEINISYPEIEQDEPLEEEVNSINHSLLAAMKNEQEALKIKILSNVLINPKAQDCENYIQDLSGLNTANSQMNEYEDCSQYFKGFTQESVEVNPFNRSILEGMKVIQKNFIESNPQIYGEVPNNGLVTTSLNIMESYEDRNSNNENDSKGIFCIQQHSNQYQFWKENSNPGVLEDMQDFQFAKPIGKPYKAQISHKHYSLPEKTREETSLDDIDHLKFSLPLLQNQERTSTPKIDIFASQNSNVCDFSNFSDNIVSKEYINSFQNSHTIAKGYNESQKAFANKETFTHVFPKVKIIQGPDNLSQSFGEEDKKIRIRPNNLKKNKSHIDNDGDRDFERIDQKTVDKVIHLLPTMEMKENEPRRLPIKVNQKRDEDIIELLPVAKDMNEDENEFEKFIVEEVKSFLRDSTDIFEGDVDSLDITVEHNKNDEDVCKRIISHSFQQTRGEKLSLTKGNTGITKQRTVTTVQSSTSNEDSHLFVSLDNQNSIEVLTQNSKFDKLGKHEKLNEVPYMTAQRINLEYQSKLEEWTPGNVENKSNRCEENEELSNNFGENLNNKVMCVTEGRNNTSKLLNPINQIVEIKEKRREKIPLNKTLKNNMFEDDSHELDQFFDADLSISAMSVGSKISRTCKKHFTDTFRRDEKHCVNVNISTEAKEKSSKYGNNSNASDNKEPLVTTSISDASRRRNLDNSSSGSKSSDIKYYYNRQTLKTSTEDQSKSDDKNKVSTSISRASLLRNLENVSSDKSTTKDCMNIKDIGELPRCREIFDSSSTSIFETAEEMSVSNISKKRTFDESFSEKSDRENDVTKSQMQTNISENHDNQKFKAEIISKESALVRNVDKDKYTFQEPLEDDSKCTLDNEECAINNLETSISSSKYNRAIKALGYTKRDNRSLGSSKNVSQPKKRRSLFGSKKLTKHEIQEEFDKQDQILFEGNVDVETYSRYLKQRMNRPSVKQLQQAEHIATIKRTENGTLVLPAKKNKCKPKKYDRKSIFESVKFIDVSIFSDENASRMSAFLASDEKNYNLFKFNSENLTSSSQLSVFSNHFVQKRKNIKFKRSKTFGGLKVNDFTRINQNESSNSFLFKQSQQSQGSSFFIPSGYFKRHKSDIENICSKYLCPNDSLW
ncbi:hypothetical protein HHI36_015382 [Cryptolaemus montrouzieri]|uniref:DNA mismatch repair proteins mutS family domain-containing protein n=1 Tax=Cryptolaemus montrouzieri TaxID=559131 RepID=A0ABD2N5Z4_9CUCU